MTYYIWTDESVKYGAKYSHFYGGIIIEAKNVRTVLHRINILREKYNWKEEIKWQKVNERWFDAYCELVDEVFDMLKCGLIKIRVFFENNNDKRYNEALGDGDAYQKLYYQFIKWSFGFQFIERTGNSKAKLYLYVDTLPIPKIEKETFFNFVQGLNQNFLVNAYFPREGIGEVDSKNHIPLQIMDVILGAVSFRLNDMHKIKNPDTGRRGKRTKLIEKLYKRIYGHLSELRSGFNLGLSTGIEKNSDHWTMPYRHWRFKPKK